MTYLIACFDLDGTLVDETGSIHPEDRRILENPPDGIILIPASGRSLDSVKKVFSRNGLFVGARFPCPLILQNGALVYAAGENLLGYSPFTPNTQNDILEMALEMDEVTYLFQSQDQIHRVWSHPFGLSRIQKYDFDVEPYDPGAGLPRCGKVMCLSEDYDALLRIRERSAGFDADAAFSMRTIFEFTPRGVNKGSGLKFLLEKTGMAPARVAAAGNDQNDFDLLRVADLKFAPKESNAAALCDPDCLLDPDRGGILAPIIHRLGSE